MNPPFELLTEPEALKLARESMAFKGDFADWLADLITNSPNTETHVADLYPLLYKSELRFDVTGENIESTLRLRDEGTAAQTPTRRHRLREPGNEAFVLLVRTKGNGRWGVHLSIASNKQGQIVDFKANGDDGGHWRTFIYICRFNVISPQPMVGWYDPFQLARTAVDVVISTIFGKNSDYRLMEALGAGKPLTPDYTRLWQTHGQERDEPYAQNGRGAAAQQNAQAAPDQLRETLWLDYVGDVGDGWNSTYAIAHTLAKPALDLTDPNNGSTYHTERGEVLVFGGDQVYPMASRKEYQVRLLQPYETALCRTPAPHPHAYAIPGNHDWYDSLVSFTRLFCSRRWFAGWQTNQTRSYFALKLPGHWWLLGTDVQLASDLDVPQVEYFTAVAEQMEQDDLVIICTAEPHWVYAALYGKNDSDFNENNLAYLEKKIIGEKAKVV
ncbi:MAG TPA: metallophosphoesterase, partial [Pyrinomonadaceae bacterium]